MKMLREGARVVRKGGERMLGVLGFLRESVIWALDTVLPWARIREDVIYEVEVLPPAPRTVSGASPLDNIGPVPEELRRDPFPGGSVPWCIQEAEKEHNRARKILMWKIAVAISWSVTTIAVLRSIGIL